eukprot:14418258-Alexandrium_andersonii.AAC.1
MVAAVGNLQRKMKGVEHSMDVILMVENEFEMFLHVKYNNLWKFTYRQAYDRVAVERLESCADLLERGAYIQDAG